MRRGTMLTVVAALAALVLSACGTASAIEMDGTRLAVIVATVRPTNTLTRTPSSTPSYTPTATASLDPAFTPVPSLPSVGLTGDPANGQIIFNDTTRGFQSCKTCHRRDTDTRLVGPGLFGIRVRAATRVEGLSAEEYVRQSITDPAAFVVPGFPNIMPRLFARTLSDQELADIAAYVLSLGE